MRNLKKSLVLVMVFAMLLGTVANAATFSDVATTNSYSEEIGLLADLGVLVGNPDGTFKPDAPITRVQAAAIIFRILSGKTDATMYEGATKFSDVAATYWGTGYINFCSGIGAIGGYPDGTFKPDSNITIAEYVSMLVRALGLTEGKNLAYPIGYLTLADANGITSEVPAMASSALVNRGVVAKLTYNTIIDATYASIATEDKEDPKIIEEVFKISPKDAYIVATQYYGVNGITATGTEDKFGYVLAADYTFDAEDGTPDFTNADVVELESAKVDESMLGLKVKVYVKTDNNSTNANKAFAVVASKDNYTKTINFADVKKDTGSGRYFVDDQGVKRYITTSAGAANYADSYVDMEATAFDDVVAVDDKGNDDPADDVDITLNAQLISQLNGSWAKTITLVSNDDKRSSFEYAFIKTYSTDVFDEVYNNKIFLEDSIIDLKDSADEVLNVSYPSDLQADDAVMIYQSYDEQITEITKATAVTATLEKIVEGSKFVFDGKTYKIAGGFGVSAFTENDIGDSFEFVVAPGFSLIVDSEESSGAIPEYLFVSGARVKADNYGTGKQLLVQGTNVAGETKEYEVEDDAVGVTLLFNDTPAAIDATPMDVFVVEISSSDKITSVKDVTVDDTDVDEATLVDADIAKDDYSTSTNILKVDADNRFTVDEKTVSFFIEDQDDPTSDIYVYTGTFPSVAGTTLKAYYENDSYKSLRAGVFEGKPAGASSEYDNVKGVLLATPSILREGDDYRIEYKLATQGAIKTLQTELIDKSDFTSVNKTLKSGDLIEFDLTTDGYVVVDGSNTITRLITFVGTEGNASTANYATDDFGLGYIRDRSASSIILTNQANAQASTSFGPYALADDVTVYYIDENSFSASSVSSLAAAKVINKDNTTSNTEYRTYVYLVFSEEDRDDEDDEVTAIYVINKKDRV